MNLIKRLIRKLCNYFCPVIHINQPNQLPELKVLSNNLKAYSNTLVGSGRLEEINNDNMQPISFIQTDFPNENRY